MTGPDLIDPNIGAAAPGEPPPIEPPPIEPPPADSLPGPARRHRRRAEGVRARRASARARRDVALDVDTSRADAPPAVVGAACAGVVPAPFLLVYAGLFLVHGLLVTPQQLDVTGSRSGESVAGALALILLIVVLVGLGNLLSGTRRWLFALGQLIVLGGSCYLIADRDTGPITLPVVVAATSLLALVLALRPRAASWVRVSRAEPERAS